MKKILKSLLFALPICALNSSSLDLNNCEYLDECFCDEDDFDYVHYDEYDQSEQPDQDHIDDQSKEFCDILRNLCCSVNPIDKLISKFNNIQDDIIEKSGRLETISEDEEFIQDDIFGYIESDTIRFVNEKKQEKINYLNEKADEQCDFGKFDVKYLFPDSLMLLLGQKAQKKLKKIAEKYDLFKKEFNVMYHKMIKDFLIAQKRDQYGRYYSYEKYYNIAKSYFYPKAKDYPNDPTISDLQLEQLNMELLLMISSDYIELQTWEIFCIHYQGAPEEYIESLKNGKWREELFSFCKQAVENYVNYIYDIVMMHEIDYSEVPIEILIGIFNAVSGMFGKGNSYSILYLKNFYNYYVGGIEYSDFVDNFKDILKRNIGITE